MSKYLVTGGAGYVGSHTVRELTRRGDSVVVVDDMSAGHAEALQGNEHLKVDLSSADAPNALDRVFSTSSFDGVLHFAAKAYVGESVRDPDKYYRNNVIGGIQLLSAMSRHGVPKLVFSSTCSTYGVPETIPIPETHPQKPINPYGQTKLLVEKALADFETAYGMRHVNLRYFNASGAHPDGDLGEVHRPETHLIPLALEAALGEREKLSVFGADYDTPDGTCVRDYIHVVDLATAHIQALDYLDAEGTSQSLNLGTGVGHSVLEVIHTVSEVSGKEVPYDIVERRDGDPPSLVAEATRAREMLGWAPKLGSLSTIVESAWRFKKNHPGGY